MSKDLKPSSKLCIDGKNISIDDPVYFIAEIGSNFDQDLERAKELIYMAKDAGADAAKFQHYSANSLVSDYGFKNMRNNNSHQSLWENSVFETYKNASLNQDWTGVLKETCRDAGLSFFTSPYSFDLVDLVDSHVPAHKIGSGDISWIKIIEHIAAKNKPVLLATGASDMVDVQRAVHAILSINPNIILLQCNTNYTASRSNFANLQLNVIPEFRRIYPGIITGLSDHTKGDVSVLGAVALGARVIEKHFTDSTDRKGPDHSFSMTPSSWRDMVERTRDLQASLGGSIKKVEDNERETRVLQRRSLCVGSDLKAGTVIKKSDLAILRPCPLDSIQPFDENKVIGKTLVRDVSNGQNLKWEYFI